MSAPAASVAEIGSASSVGGLLISLLLVLGLIFLLAWLLRRMPRMNLAAQGPLRIRHSLSLGVKERLLLVEANGETLLLGITAQHITCLHRFDTPPPESEPGKTPFAEILQRGRDQAGNTLS